MVFSHFLVLGYMVLGLGFALPTANVLSVCKKILYVLVAVTNIIITCKLDFLLPHLKSCMVYNCAVCLYSHYITAGILSQK